MAATRSPQTQRRCGKCRQELEHYATVKHNGVETELWRCNACDCDVVEGRCQCGAKLYERVSGKVAVAVGSAKARRLRLVVEQESGVIECRCRRVHRL